MMTFSVTAIKGCGVSLSRSVFASRQEAMFDSVSKNETNHHARSNHKRPAAFASIAIARHRRFDGIALVGVRRRLG